MLNLAARTILTASALSPPLLILAANIAIRDIDDLLWTAFLSIGAGLFALSLFIILATYLRTEIHDVTVTEVDPRNYEALTFLFAYIFPFVRQDFTGTTANLATTVTIFGILVVVLVHAGAFHFNPLLRLLGYRFYSIKTRSGVFSLIIMRDHILICPTEVRAVTLAPGVYLQKGKHSAQ